MLTASHLLRLPCTPDLIEGGIAYATRSLTYAFDRAGSSPYDRLRRVVANVAVELAFRRILSQQNIPFEVKSSLPFTDHERYDVSLGGRRCDVKSFLISNSQQVSKIRSSPNILLSAPALVPSDQHAADGHADTDLYLFAFVSGLIAASQADLKKAIDTRQRHYLVHAMPQEWRKPLNWNPLGPLALKSESDEELLVEVSGQDEARGFLTRTFSLPPKTKVTIHEPFYSLTSVHVRRLPDARVGIFSATRNETYIIAPLDWANLWLHGMDIYFTGYVSRGEFRQRARAISAGSRVFQYSTTHAKNLAMTISDLNSLDELFANVRAWEAKK